MINIYKSLNSATEYIECNLSSKIDYLVLARFFGTNVSTMRKIFFMMTENYPAEYIRKRRLSNAGIDIIREKCSISYLATKYQYENSASFSRAFYKFHGVRPSSIEQYSKLKIFPKISFKEDNTSIAELEYEIVELGNLRLYGVGINTNNSNIIFDAPRFFRDTNRKYQKQNGAIKYAATFYDDGHEQSQKYYCLYDHESLDFENVNIENSKWLKLRVPSQRTVDIQKTIRSFYDLLLPSTQYKLRCLPEIEYYHDSITDFLVAVE